MSRAGQAKLLRVLQEREFQRVGGTRTLKADIRVIAATNCDLRKAVQRGDFRQDLLYRLEVFDIRIPPLRERRADIVPLTDALLRDIAAASAPGPGRVAGGPRSAVRHDWPGNVRQLRNALERATILADGGLIQPEHLALRRGGRSARDSATDLNAMERETIVQVCARRAGTNRRRRSGSACRGCRSTFACGSTAWTEERASSMTSTPKGSVGEVGMGRRKNMTGWRPTRASGRWRFLADASAALDTSIEYEQTLANTVRLAVPEVADYCVVMLLDQDGVARWADSAHRDPGRAVLLESLRGFPPPPAADLPGRRALRTGRPQLVSDASVEMLEWLLETPLRHMVDQLAPRSAIGVPMIARGRTFGAIIFVVTAESGRRYGARDLELATDVGRRAGFAIDHALLYQAAERAARARDDLMAMVAHDLKNPLSNIHLALRALLDDDACPSDRFDDADRRALERHALGAEQRAAERMSRLIHDLLEVARVDAGRLLIQPTPSDPHALLREAMDAHREVAAANSITFEAKVDEDLPQVMADRERIAQVFSNLIGNALKFTPSGGRVAVHGSRATPDVRFAVEDTGPGIPSEHQGHVFDRFWQAKNASRMGTGLGLSIAKSIVEGHGGQFASPARPDKAPGSSSACRRRASGAHHPKDRGLEVMRSSLA